MGKTHFMCSSYFGEGPPNHTPFSKVFFPFPNLGVHVKKVWQQFFLRVKNHQKVTLIPFSNENSFLFKKKLPNNTQLFFWKSVASYCFNGH
jgi:hypothetical protein